MPEDKQLRKQYIAKTEVDTDERTVTAVINTDVVDREKEVLLPNGANLEQYLKNPVVLWAHQYSATPIARTLWMKKGRKHITAKAQFAETPLAEEVYQLFKGGFLSAFSVGFLPAENGSHPPTPEEVKKHPGWAEAKRIYDDWELLEFSVVPVPANPDALATAVKSKDISLSKELQEQLGVENSDFCVEHDEEFYAAANVSGGFVSIDCDFAKDFQAKVIPDLKPEETDDFIRIPVRDCKVTATITISAKEGIKALYCGKVKKVRTYLFAKAKGWTMAKAKAWVKEHDSGKEGTCLIDTDALIATDPIIVTFPPDNTKKTVTEAINRIKGIIYM